MSTKTSFKRIAAVAAVALTLGGLSAVSANAAGMLADSLVNAVDGTSVVASTAQVGSGTPATAKIVYSSVATSSADTATVTGSILSVPATSGAYNVTFAETAGTSPDSTSPVGAISGNTLTTSGAGRVTKYITASFTPDVAGTYVIALKAAGGVNNSTVTWTVVATGVPAATAASSTVAFYSKAVNGGSGTPGTTPNIKNDYEYKRFNLTETLDVALAELVAAAPTTGVFAEPVTPANAGDIVGSGIVHFSNKTVVAANTAVSVPMTVTISGHGYVGIGAAPSTYGLTVTETDSVGYTPFGDPSNYGRIKYFTVKSDGTTGPATITVTAGGVVLGTASMVFTGAKASLALATGTLTKLSKSYIGATETATVTVNGLDASSNILSASGITAVTGSDTTGSIAQAAISGNVVTVTGGLVSGSVTWTVTDGTRTVTFVTNTVKKTAKTVALSLSSDTAAPGEKVTLTITAKDANGSPVADGSRQLFSAGLTTNLAVGASTCTTDGSVSLVGGVATCTFFAPSTPGTLTISALEGSATDNVIANTSTAAATISASLAVVNAAADSAQAAIDAAQEATDAANAAYDAANNAMDSADAATAAAQDASDNASAALAAVTSLSATVAKLVKSVTAIATALASIKKKLGVK